MNRQAPHRRLRSCALALALLAGCGGPPRASADPSPSTAAAPAAAKKRPPRRAPPKAKPKAEAAPTAKDPGASTQAPAPSDDGGAEPTEVGAVQRGQAVWYGADWHGKPTASGERFDRRKMTAAHRTLPMGAMVRVTHEGNGSQVTVRINDRGPFGKRRQRIIDVSEAAARVLGIIDAGVGPVSLEVISLPASRKGTAR